MSGEDAGRAAAARRAIVGLCAAGLAPLELLSAVAREVRRAVPYTAAGWQLVDPATLLATGGVAGTSTATLICASSTTN